MRILSKEKLQRSASLGVQGYTCDLVGWNHMTRFMYALKSPETRRQYHRRLKVFLDFLDPQYTSLDEQATQFLYKVTQDPRWFEDRFMDFIGVQLARVSKGD